MILAQGLRGREAVAQTSPSKAVGAWLVTFPSNAATGDDPDEHQMLVLTSDGTVIASNTPTSPPDPENGPPLRTFTTPSFGAWTTTELGQIRLVMNSVDSDEQGHFVDLVQITVHVTMDAAGNSFTGAFGVLVTDASGAVLFDSQGDYGTVQGTRIVA
jgi:hypothetical protein